MQEQPCGFSAETEAFWKRELVDGGRDWYIKSAKWWIEHCPPTVNGVLGGFAKVDPADVRESARFLETILALRAEAGHPMRRERAMDGGAGIGRVTKNFLSKYFDTVDLVEGNRRLLDEAPSFLAERRPHLGEMFCATLQEFTPPEGRYDCIWVQWVVIYLTDDDFVKFLQRCVRGLRPNGLIFIKENVLDKGNRLDLMKDEDDSSVTRSQRLMLHIFRQAGLDVLIEQPQEEWEENMLPVMMYALCPQA